MRWRVRLRSRPRQSSVTITAASCKAAPDNNTKREISPVGMTETRRSTWVVAGPAKHTMPISKPSAWRSPPRHQAHAGTAMQPTSSAVQTMAVARAEAASDRNGSAAVTATPAPAKAQGHQRARGARVPNAVATLTKISMVTSASVGRANADRSFHAAWRGHSSQPLMPAKLAAERPSSSVGGTNRAEARSRIHTAAASAITQPSRVMPK